MVGAEVVEHHIDHHPEVIGCPAQSFLLLAVGDSREVQLVHHVGDEELSVFPTGSFFFLFLRGLCEDRGHGSCSNLLSFWLYLFLLCLSRQTSHLIWSWIAGFRQSQQSPRDFASARLAWVLRRCSSRRSGVWGLFRSYFRPFSALALTFLGFVLGWRSVCCACG